MLRDPRILGNPQRQVRGAKSESSPTKGNKIRSGYLTPAFSGAQKRAEMLGHPYILGGPRTGVQKAASLDEWKKAPAGDKIKSGQPTRGPKDQKPNYCFFFGGTT